MLIVSNATKSFNDLVFNGISFTASTENKIAVIGANGAGKTTLFNLILGKTSLDDGKITITGSSTIGWMPQTIDELDLPDMEVYEFLLSGRPIKKISEKLITEYEELSKTSNPEEHNQKLHIISNLEKEFEKYGGHKAESELNKIISGMNISDETLLNNLSEISGGQKSKVAFARALYASSDILLLDEPTNHLDSETREWIISYLKSYKGILLIISHDSDFLQRIANKILYINNITKKAELFDGDYKHFLVYAEEKKLSLDRAYKNQQRKIEKLETFIEGMQGVSGKRKRQAQSREKTLEKLQQNTITTVKEGKAVRINLKPRRIEQKNVVTVNQLTFGYQINKILINDLSFSLSPEDRLVIVGHNGVGKSTLLKLLAKRLKPLKGSIVFGNKTDTAYYSQEHEDLNLQNDLLTEISSISTLTTKQLRRVLGGFNFSGDKVFQEIKTLSPGERSRLALAKLCIEGGNFLLLDEPTNHLDLQTKKSVATALSDYGGAILLVSHDTDFIEMLGIDRMLILPTCKVRLYDKNLVNGYESY